MAAPPPDQHFVVADAAAWRAWLDAHEDLHDGVWLVLAKKGVTEPTSITYDQALDEALCSGWIDGQVHSLDASTYLQRFTPRRKRSIWSARNVGHIARLEQEGRMRPRGRAEVEAAKADGRWERAYGGDADTPLPAELRAALDADPQLAAAFAALGKTARMTLTYQLSSAVKPETRQRRLEQVLSTLREASKTSH
jgi:uncharacterized protein YdeI (YjbR/CyaY-like superfamily)